jgi:hypothetical protein
MTKEFLTYELALKLKEVGFNEPCMGYYDCERDLKLVPNKNKFLSCEYAAPLYQQVFRWFREKHNLYVVIIPTVTMYWTFKTMTVVEGIVDAPPYNHVDANDYPTYEEAEIESVKELIKIVKQITTKKQ